jgi:hypothetical protein
VPASSAVTLLRLALGESGDLGLVAAVDLDQGGVAQDLLGEGADFTPASAYLSRRGLDPLGEEAGDQPEHRHRDHRNQCQLPAQVEQHPSEQTDLDDLRGGVSDPGEDQVLDRAHVPGESAEGVAQWASVEKVYRQGLQVGEHSGP